MRSRGQASLDSSSTNVTEPIASVCSNGKLALACHKVTNKNLLTNTTAEALREACILSLQGFNLEATPDTLNDDDDDGAKKKRQNKQTAKGFTRYGSAFCVFECDTNRDDDSGGPSFLLHAVHLAEPPFLWASNGIVSLSLSFFPNLKQFGRRSRPP